MSERAAASARARHAGRILRAAIDASDPYAHVIDALGRELAASTGPGAGAAVPVHIIAAGKAACRMAAAATDALGAGVASRLVIVPHGTACDGALRAGHPEPDESSAAAGRAIEAAVRRAGRDELILVLLSGGASALMAAPASGITVAEYAACVTALQRAGADIRALNTVRRHIDTLKGGRLARLAAPRPVLGLVLSDVVGDPLDVIASGPLTPHAGPAADAVAVLQRYHLWDGAPPSIRLALTAGAAAAAATQPAATRVRTVLVGSNRLARDGAAAEARLLGYPVRTLEEPVTGEARDAGTRLAALAVSARMERDAAADPYCIIAGGETTVTVRGAGRGGRNQELVLAAAIALDGTDGITIASAGTDGIDGASDAAGAIADGGTVQRGRDRGVAAAARLMDNDSHGFFRSVGGLLVTGPTGTNVMDVHVILVGLAAGAG